jgi:hypothetical protein
MGQGRKHGGEVNIVYTDNLLSRNFRIDLFRRDLSIDGTTKDLPQALDVRVKTDFAVRRTGKQIPDHGPLVPGDILE